MNRSRKNQDKETLNYYANQILVYQTKNMLLVMLGILVFASIYYCSQGTIGSMSIPASKEIPYKRQALEVYL